MKYKNYRIPIDVDKLIMGKKANMESTLKQISGKVMKIPKTKVLRIILSKPAYIDDFELKNNFMGKKRRGLLTL